MLASSNIGTVISIMSMNTKGKETQPPEETEMPKESLSDCLPSSSIKKVKYVPGLARIYDDSSNNTFFRVTHLSDSSKGEFLVCMNEHPNVLRRNSLNVFKGRQIVKRIKEETGITKVDIELCATSGNTPSHNVYAAYAILKRSQLAIELVTEVAVE